jgi:hypothetical protein
VKLSRVIEVGHGAAFDPNPSLRMAAEDEERREWLDKALQVELEQSRAYKAKQQATLARRGKRTGRPLGRRNGEPT